MASYLGKRFLLFIPTLWLVSLLAFALQESAPGDPVTRILGEDYLEVTGSVAEKKIRAAALHRAIRETGADLPAFYLSIRPLSMPDTLHRIQPWVKQQAWQNWCTLTGQPKPVSDWYRTQDEVSNQIPLSDPNQNPADLKAIHQVLTLLPLQENPRRAQTILKTWPEGIYPEEKMALAAAIPQPGSGFLWRNWTPRIQWHGTHNRYHFWLKGLFSAEGHVSWTDGQPAVRKIMAAVRWTLLLNGIAILLAYLLAIPLGVWMAGKYGSSSERWATLLTYALYSIPGFWLGTLLLVFLTSPTYGMDFFPSLGLGTIPENAGLWEILQIRSSHLVLPVFCLTYGSVAYLARHVRNAVLQELKKEYIRAAWSRGLNLRQILWKQAFPNALFPLITLFAHVLPAAIAGSVAIEVIFNIPGMGRLTYQSILSQDWPVVYPILLLAAVLTLIGSLLADVLYAFADPRVKFGRT
jgi:peptide/nickel transport system permease protein